MNSNPQSSSPTGESGNGNDRNDASSPIPNKTQQESSEFAEQKQPAQPHVTGWKRTAFFCLGGLFFSLGAAGAILPVLPTTPFLLLASYFLLRSSPRLNRRLLRSRFFGPILKDWQERRGVRLDVKVKSCVIVVLTVSLSIVIAKPAPFVAATIFVMASIGIFVIWRLPAIK